jgi:hypothetical protein
MQLLMAFNINSMTLFIPEKCVFTNGEVFFWGILLGTEPMLFCFGDLQCRNPAAIVRPRTEYLDCCFCFVEEEAVFLGGWRGWLPNY